MKISDVDGVRTVTFDRPGVMNAVTVETATELAETIEDVDAETHDAVVLTGEGAAFSAGGDIETMVDTEANAVETFDGIAETFGRVVEAAITSRVPIVAKVNGDAVGAGLALAALSDFAYAADSASFSCAFVRVGLIPDTGGTFLLPQLVGLRTAKRLAMTGEFISADEAADIDLINDAVPDGELDERVDELLSTLRKRPTKTVGLTKRALHENAGKHWREALDHENTTQALARDTPEHEEGVAAFLEGRDPEF
ncbi:enoyl-CoA hydratase/isomerase family protein [Natronoarchaeum sp. GCM10025321]|uniref:enoyl-CoA hydratase/isomerase family protein n=1 Tax=Natronoarchaeum sp. GCM10025321 TaxID=3252684 RepID=UPI00360E33D9